MQHSNSDVINFLDSGLDKFLFISMHSMGVPWMVPWTTSWKLWENQSGQSFNVFDFLKKILAVSWTISSPVYDQRNIPGQWLACTVSVVSLEVLCLCPIILGLSCCYKDACCSLVEEHRLYSPSGLDPSKLLFSQHPFQQGVHGVTYEEDHLSRKLQIQRWITTPHPPILVPFQWIVFGKHYKRQTKAWRPPKHKRDYHNMEETNWNHLLPKVHLNSYWNSLRIDWYRYCW